METIAAIELARAAKAPVRVAYDRHEELSVAGYRPAAEVKIALLPSAQGELKALSMTAHADTGAATNSTIAALARLIYPAEAKALADFDVISNLPPGAPFRGPGGPPMAFALEQAIDEAALRMKVDPIALAQALGSRSQPAAALRLGGRPRSLAQPQHRPPLRAAAIAAASASPPDTGCISGSPARRSKSPVKGGRLVASTAMQDIGTGSRSVIANTVAREFGLEPHEIEVRIGDSRSAGRTGLRRQPHHRLGRAADAARDRKTEGGDRSAMQSASRSPAPTRRGASCSRRRPILPRRRRTRPRTPSDWRPASARR